MKRDRLNWGLVLLFIGVMWLLSNFGVVTFYWSSLWRFWPIFLIIIGVNLLVPRHGYGNIISVIATIGALVFIGYQSSRPTSSWKEGSVWRNLDEGEDDGDGVERRADFVTAFEEQVKEVNLEIKGGAVEYNVGGETDELFKAETKSNFAGHVLQSSTRDSIADLSFRMKNTKGRKWNLRNNGENEAKMYLNTNPIWNIKAEVGAGAIDFDLSRYKVRKLTFKGGAASFETKLGMPLESSEIFVESGVASIEIAIPQAAACRIQVESGLSSKDFPGFTKRDDGSYATADFDQASNKYLINLKGGLSSFSVERY
ncbi:hypothetical protein H8S90_07765 [Olivibacter sp. SDN3]|uniref:LiaF transmembrane domain-containing protein n=1 Tax=Olivibacter sp. SDN3 TaxID=2764720 RepID=UPI001650DB2F|nr:DUF5668 domain-containing protein [Olivibacter sp. SDN3]QNL51460.1 hypothetical protein H8S90_07765 [Olivibacter sp. SDN3]